MNTSSLFLFITFYCIYKYTSIEIIPELKKNILQFGYRINYKYEGTLAHSFDRFYVVTKFILPSINDFKSSKVNYDNTCVYLDEKSGHDLETKKYTLDLLLFCKRIEPHVNYYRKQIQFHNDTVHHILKNEIDLILPTLPAKQSVLSSPHWFQAS